MSTQPNIWPCPASDLSTIELINISILVAERTGTWTGVNDEIWLVYSVCSSEVLKCQCPYSPTMVEHDDNVPIHVY
jgi:hypothetical protein